MPTGELQSQKPLKDDDLWFPEPALFDWDAENIFLGPAEKWEKENANLRGIDGDNS